MADFWATLFPNKWHKQGDRKPVATGAFEITEPLPPGKYKMAAWRKGTSLKIKFSADAPSDQQAQPKQDTPQPTKSQTPPPSAAIKNDADGW